MARRWSEVIACPVRPLGGQGFEIVLQRGLIRFVPVQSSRVEGLSAFEVVAADRDRLLSAARARGAVDRAVRIQIGGVRIDLAGD